MKQAGFSVTVAAILWFVMFSPWTASHLNFWLTMSASAVILILLCVFFGGNMKEQFQINLKDTLIGLASAAVLWGIFWLGDFLSTLWFDFAKPQISEIYSLKAGESPLVLIALLLLVIGPAEEIFWRGFVQRTLCKKYGEWAGWIIATIVYALVHVWSFNFMLIMAALVCGGFWGLLYNRNKNLSTLVVSHAVWDVAVFVVFPF